MLSETCEFLGVSGSLDTPWPMPAGRWCQSSGRLCEQRLHRVFPQYAVGYRQPPDPGPDPAGIRSALHGYLCADDLVWYNAQGGKRPHAAAAYPLLFGDVGVRLIEPNAAPAPQEVQQAA